MRALVLKTRKINQINHKLRIEETRDINPSKIYMDKVLVINL